MKKVTKTKISFTSLLLLLLCHFSYAQNKLEANSEIATYLDSYLGKENLSFNNGSLYTDQYLTKDNVNNHNYFLHNKYTKGTLVFEDQNYYDLELKYDCYKDALITRSNGQYPEFGINVVKDKTSSFTIYDKKFINIDLSPYNKKSFQGYWEENLVGSKITLYVKYSKKLKTVFSNNLSYSDFKEYTAFVVLYNSNLESINSEKEAISIFKGQKNEIIKFYSKNYNLKQSNQLKFTENLLLYLENLLSNSTN